MIKKFNTFINESYYNSHGSYASWADIRDIEVYDRENYTPEEFKEWQDKYDITDGDQVIWVTKNKKQAYAYLLPADYHDTVLNMSDRQIKMVLNKNGQNGDELTEIKETDGFIIPESDDGDGGYLFVKR